MIRTYAQEISNRLMQSLPWLREFAILTRKYNTGLRISGFENDQNFAINDALGNQGYLRYTGNTQDIVYTNPPRKLTNRHRIASCDLTCVIVYKGGNPEEVATGITEIIAQTILSENALIEIQSTDADRFDILNDEIKQDSENWNACRIRFIIRWSELYKSCEGITQLNLMNRCCPQVIDLGCVNSCGVIVTEFVLDETQLRLEFEFEGALKTILYDHPGGAISIPVTTLNENYVYGLRIFAGDSDVPEEFTSGTITTSCLQFKISPSL